MTRKAKLHWLSAIQFVTVLAMFPVGFCWNFWGRARTHEDALRWYPGLDIPGEWKAVIISHGTPIEWPLGAISPNPLGFALCTLALAAFLATLLWTTRLAARLKGFKNPGLNEMQEAPHPVFALSLQGKEGGIPCRAKGNL